MNIFCYLLMGQYYSLKKKDINFIIIEFIMTQNISILSLIYLINLVGVKFGYYVNKNFSIILFAFIFI